MSVTRPLGRLTARLLGLMLFPALMVSGGCAITPTSQRANPTPVEEAVSTAQFETIVVFSSGNIQGALLASEPAQGGMALLESYYKIAQHDFGTRAVWLDAGNIRGHALETDFDQGQSFVAFLQRGDVAATLGSEPSHVLIDTGRIKLGVIGARSDDEVLLQSRAAREAGAQLVVWLSDLPIQCNSRNSRATPLFRKPGDSNGFCEGKLNDILSHLPEGTVNAVLTSGSDRQVQHFIYPRYSSDPLSGVPVVEAAPFGKNVHLIYLTYDLVNRQIVPGKTRIEGPVPVCGKIFKNQGDCDETREAPENGRGSLVRSRFHGKPIEADPEVQRLAEPAQNWIRAQEKEIIVQNDELLSANPLGESNLANLVADAFRSETQSDFAIVHPGLIKHAVGHAETDEG